MMTIAGFAALAACGAPALAQTAPNGTAAAEGFALPLNLPPDADTGKPRLVAPPPAIEPPPGCAAVLDCRMQIIGAIQRDGAVELNTSVLRW